MDAVPFAFCSAVAATLRTPSSIGERISSRIWRTAAVDDDRRRQNCGICINYREGAGWSYGIWQGGSAITFLKLKELNRRDLRIENVSACKVTGSVWSSFEEIREIANYTLPCVSAATLFVDENKNWPQNDLLELLSIYKHSAFVRICTRYNPSLLLDFLLPHLTSDLLKNVSIDGAACSLSLKEAVRDAALHKQWKHLDFRVCDAKIDLDFLEALFQKPVTQEQEEYHFYFSFKKSALKKFKRDWRTSTRTRLEWKRPDGVKIEINAWNISQNVCSITFWKN